MENDIAKRLLGAAHCRDAVRFDFGDREQQVEHEGTAIRYYHREGDAAGVLRLGITTGKHRLELLPSKGLSVGGVSYEGRELFWDSPIHSLPHPDTVEPWDEIIVNGEPVRGMGFLKTFCGGIELMGLDNWGVPWTDEPSGELLPLHGEVSAIPVETLSVFVSTAGVQVTAAFGVPTFKGADGPWYRRGTKLYTVEKNISVKSGSASIILYDRIVNASTAPRTPDWGYHIQLRPEAGAEFLVPARDVVMRFGEPAGPGFNRWQPAPAAGGRIERGYIYTGLRARPDLLLTGEGVESLLVYPDAAGILVTVPRVPYYQGWFSAGGRGSDEFCVKTENGVKSLLDNDWNGVGPEIGNSPLDHNDRYDSGVLVKPLKPGESLDIHIEIKPLTKKETAGARERIMEFAPDT